jgi:hypothetical protein
MSQAAEFEELDEPHRAHDWVRLPARVFLLAGVLAVALAIAEAVNAISVLKAAPVPRQIATPAPFFLALNPPLLPVGPFAAWGILTVLCDIRDEPRGWSVQEPGH